MAKRKSKSKYQRRKRKNRDDLAFIEPNGQRLYIGVYGSPNSKQEYRRLVAEYMTGGGKLSVNPDEITMLELVALFWHHVKGYYRKPDGTQTSEVDNVRQAMRPLQEYLPVEVQDGGGVKELLLEILVAPPDD